MPSRVTRLDRPLALRYLLLGATLVAPASCGGDAKVGDQDTAVDTTVVIDDTSADVTADSADSAADTADVADGADVADSTETATDAADSGDSADVSDDVDAVACQGASGCACDDEHACDDPLVCHDATCAACQNGWTDCPCDGTDATCEVDAVCVDGTCVACAAGSVTCLCRPIGDPAGTCDSGLACLSGYCVDADCTLGAPECPCTAAGGCSGTGTCSGGICQTCSPGTAGCACAGGAGGVGGTCGASLVCAPNGSCIAATTTCDSGVSGSVGQTCAAQHRACVADPSLGTGSCAGCAAGFVDEGGTCRAVKTCGDLTCTGTGQTCVAAGANSDAFCGCAAAYLPDGSGGCRLRVTCAALGCATSGRTCSDNAGADSVCGACLATHVDVGGTCYPSCTTLGCAAAGKTCSTSGIPACGACLGGWLPNSSGTCVDVVTCSEISCPVGVCVEGNADSHSNATCDTEGSCSATQVRQPGGQCVTCTDCDGIDDPAGSTGDHYSSPAGDGTCVCKTQPAWFVSSLSGHPVLPCDADGDGWVRRSAYDAKGSPFPEVQAEATCDVRKIDRFLLMPDEPGGKPVVVMVDDLGTDSGVESDGLNHYVELYEPDVLDDDARVAQAHVAGSSVENHLRLQPYGLVQQTPTRRFVASELNPLTKYCNHQDDDYNWDFVSDATEWYRSVPVPPPGGNLTWMTPFVRMSYFGELNRGYYVPPGGNATIPSTCQAVRWVGAAWTAKPCVGLAGSGYGAWVVQEKRRVAGAPDTLRLELASAVSEPTSATAGYGVSHDLRDASYWRSCRRNRPATFDASLPPDTSPSTPTIGARNLDFARFSCPDRTRGACYSSDPLMRPNDVSVPYDGRLPAGPRVNALADRVSFAGMNHPSQFRCMRPVPQPTQVADPSDQIAANALQTPDHLDARFQLVECGLSANASLRDAPPDGSSVNPRDPAIECRLDNVPVAPASQGYFQWVVTRHATYARDAEGTPAYALGCIDEAVEWPFLCDGFHRDPFLNRATPTADATNFGHLQCGCGQSGGAACEVGCPTADAVHAQTSPPYDPTSRAGYWLCGEAGIMTPEYDPATYAGMAPGDLPPGLMTVTAPSPDGSGTSGVWSLRVETRSTQPVLPGTTRACATLTTEIGTTGTVCVSP